ncbi:hypothetical protein COY15_05115 [Candidatus Roizmanbacteria bacterium CG_4_10_14_0_2_um_filter_39_12]|nr:MAG: hypothetical protein COY15_05115 [Candidatus Roizmanbacteria bacterium CG_4_10_14_0_2_um_filter_39_12]
MSSLNCEQLVEFDLYGRGRNRYAMHNETMLVGPEYASLFDHLDLPLVSFETLRDTLGLWTGGKCQENGSHPEEYYLTHAVILGSNQATNLDKHAKILTDTTSDIMRPSTPYHDEKFMKENGARAYKIGIDIRDIMEKRKVKISQWGILLPENIHFSKGTTATISIDTRTGISVGANLWLPPSWDQQEYKLVEGLDRELPTRVYSSMMEVRPPCSTRIYTTMLNVTRK